MKAVFTCQPTSEKNAKEEIKEKEGLTFEQWIGPNTGIVNKEKPSFDCHSLIFIRHLFPIQLECSLEDALEQVKTLAFSTIDFEWPFALHIRSEKDQKETASQLEKSVIQELEEIGYSHDRKQTTQILSIFMTSEKVFAGVSSAEENLSKWNGGEVHYSPKGTISRAELKLEEVFSECQTSLPEKGRALDLGAAPGGWTHFLLEKGFRVTAVDPAKMDQRVQTKKMRHYKMVTQQFIREVPQKTYDVIVNDMKMDMWESVDILLDFEDYLTEDGKAVLTLKLPKHIRYRTVQQALDKLRTGFVVLETKQLFHNRSEITVILGSKKFS